MKNSVATVQSGVVGGVRGRDARAEMLPWQRGRYWLAAARGWRTCIFQPGPFDELCNWLAAMCTRGNWILRNSRADLFYCAGSYGLQNMQNPNECFIQRNLWYWKLRRKKYYIFANYNHPYGCTLHWTSSLIYQFLTLNEYKIEYFFEWTKYVYAYHGVFTKNEDFYLFQPAY